MEHLAALWPDPKALSVIVSYSPHAGPRPIERRAIEIAGELERGGYEVRLTQDLGDLEALAAHWGESGKLRAVVACGGDGTAAVVRNHTPLEVPIVVVPLGTENLLGRYLRQPASAAAVRNTVDQGVVIGLDLGVVRRGDRANVSQYFLMMISAGFDADVVRRLHQRRSGHITRLSYIQPTLEAIRSYEYPELQLYCRDGSAQPTEAIRCRWAFGFNLPLYARGWKVAPDATGTDGLVDICTFERGSLVDGMRYLWHVMRETHQNLADARITRGRAFRIESAGRDNVAYQLDGDYAGTLPVDVELLPGQLRVLVMPDMARRLGFAIEQET